MIRNPNATLWLLAYDGITAGTHVSIIDEIRDWPNLAHSVMPGESLLDRVRSRVASLFLLADRRTAGDVLLFVDADISWQSGDLSHIARRALERDVIVGGIYPKRAFGEGSALRFKKQAGSYQIGTDQLIPCEYVGNGFIAIPRTIVRAVADTMPWVKDHGASQAGGYWPVFLSQIVHLDYGDETGNEFLPEDWSFQARAKALGYQCYADTFPRLRHEGHYTYRLVDATARPPADEDITITIEERTLSTALIGAKE